MKRKSIIVVLFLLLVSFCFTLISYDEDGKTEKTRNILVQDLDVQCALNSTFESYEMNTVDKEIRFNANMSLDKSLDADYNALSDYDDTYDVTISANFDFDTHIMYISYFVYDNNELLETGTLMGSPCITEDGTTDVAFYDDGEIIYLSELDVTTAINECGFFSALRNFASKCAKALEVIVPVCSAVAVVAGAVAVTCVTCGIGGVAILGVTVATSTLVSVAAVSLATPLIIGGIAISADIVAELGEGILAMTQVEKDSLNSLDDLIDKDEVKTKLKELGISKEDLKTILKTMLGITSLYAFEKTTDKVLCIGRDLSGDKSRYVGASDTDFTYSYEKVGHWAFFSSSYNALISQYGEKAVKYVNYLLILYCCYDDWDFMLVTNPYYYIPEHSDVMVTCTYTDELQLIRSNSYNNFINYNYTWSTIPKPASIWSFAGYRVSR